MKARQIIAAVFLFAGLCSNAQAFKCEEGFKLFTEKATAQQYDEAYKLLPQLQKNCGKYDIALYTTAEKVLTYRFETAVKDADKKKALQDLSALYDEQQKNFPGTGAIVKKTMLLHENGQLDDDKTYAAFAAQFAADRSQFTDYKVIELYFQLFIKNRDIGKVDRAAFVTTYIDIYSQATTALSAVNAKRAQLGVKEKREGLTPDDKAYIAATKYDAEGFAGVLENISKTAPKYFTCEKLEEIYTAGYKQNSDDMNWIAGMVNMMSTSKCYRSDLLFTGANLLNNQNPTYENAYRLGYLSQKRNDVTQAVVFYEKAAELQEDEVKKSELYMVIAGIYNNGNKADAKRYALKAAASNPKNGQPYILLAEMYAAVTPDCNFSDFDKKAILYLAIDTLAKAEAADAKYKPTVDALIKQYSKNLPTKKEAKAAKKSKGDTVTFGCWINESIVLPKLQ